MKLKFKKIFQNLKEGEDIFSIVAYQKTVYSYYKNGFLAKDEITYKHFLRIDFWIFIVDFYWFS